jgi:hypothetical protein
LFGLCITIFPQQIGQQTVGTIHEAGTAGNEDDEDNDQYYTYSLTEEQVQFLEDNFWFGKDPNAFVADLNNRLTEKQKSGESLQWN